MKKIIAFIGILVVFTTVLASFDGYAVAAEPSISILTPTAGQEIGQGLPYTITWTTSGIPAGDSVGITLIGQMSSLGYPLRTLLAGASGTDNDGSFIWNVPRRTPGDYFTIELETGVADGDSGMNYLVTSEPFSIVENGVPLISTEVTAPLQESEISGEAVVSGRATSSFNVEIVSMKVLANETVIFEGTPSAIYGTGTTFNTLYAYGLYEKWDTTKVPDGLYLLHAEATDISGTTSEVANEEGVWVTVNNSGTEKTVIEDDTQLISTRISRPSSNVEINGKQPITGHAWSSNQNDITSMQLWANGILIYEGAQSEVVGSFHPREFHLNAWWDTTAVLDGRYFIHAKATDSEGNTSNGGWIGSWVTVNNSGTEKSVGCLPDGTLVKLPNDSKIYVIKDCKKRWIRSGKDFTNNDYDWISVMDVSGDVLSSYPEFAREIAHRSLFRFSDGPDVYEVRYGTLYKIPDVETLVARRFTWDDVEVIDRSFVEDLSMGSEFMPEGALFRARGTNDVWIVKYVGEKQFKRLVLNPRVFESYGHLRWEDVRDVDVATMNVFPTATLVRIAGTSQIYRLTPNGDIGVRQRISSARLAEMGLDVESVYEINATDYDSYEDGEAIE